MTRLIHASRVTLPYVESFLAGFGTGVLVSALLFSWQ